MTMLTESQVADRLRCSRAAVKNLRLSGKLPYIARRPPLIAEADLDAYLQSIKVGGRRHPGPPPHADRHSPDQPADSGEVAHRIWIARHLRQRKS